MPRTIIDVSELMDTPEGCDEIGTPDEHLDRCDDCGALFRTDGWHQCATGNEVSPA